MQREEFEIEVCATSIQSVLAAEKGGANRIELCDNIYEGGTTPSIGTLIQVNAKANIDVFVMIRPRGGDFFYSNEEFEIMLKDVELARNYGADGFVFGCLNADGTINTVHCARLIEKAKGLPVTFHRAFDMCNDPFTALEEIRSLGIQRILTSGLKNKAIDGIELLSELVARTNEFPQIMVGSGVDESNIAEIALKTKAKAFHVSLRKKVASKMQFRKAGIFMGGLPQVPEFEISITDEARIQKVIEILSGI